MWNLAAMVARVVGLFRDVATVRLSDGECEAEGVPYGSTEQAVFAFPHTSASRWYVDVWDDGDCCVKVKVLGWLLEVHYTRPGPVAG